MKICFLGGTPYADQLLDVEPANLLHVSLLACEGTHAGFDKHLAHFFWERFGDKRKYHWVSWKRSVNPKTRVVWVS